MSWTTPQDVTDRWIGDEIPASTQQLQLFINSLEAQAVRSIPSIETDIATGKLSEHIAIDVISFAVIEYLIAANSPYDSESQSVGEFSRSVSVSDRYRRKLRLTAEDLKQLSSTEDTLGNASVIDMSRTDRARSDCFMDEFCMCGCTYYLTWTIS